MDNITFANLNSKIKGVATGFKRAYSNGDGTYTVEFIDGTKVVTNPIKGDKGDKGDKGVSVVNAYTQDEHLFIKLDNGQTIDCGEVGSNVPQSLIDTITENKVHIGTLANLKVGTYADLVSAINAVYDLGASKFEYADKTLNITTRGGVVIPIDVSAIITDTNIDEFKNVAITDVADGNVLTYDGLESKWVNKVNDVTAVLEQAKEYTDQEVVKAQQSQSFACDTKPTYDSSTDTVTYIQGGESKTDENTKSWFYYEDENGNDVQTRWINGIEFTIGMGSISLEDYVAKTDVTSLFEENPSDLSKIPNLNYMKALRDVLITAIGKKVNKTDIVDDLLSDSVDKPLSAKQGKQLNAKIESLIDDDNASETSTYSSKKIDEAIDGVNPSWSGTQAEFDALDKDTLKDGQIINIIDDFDDKLINDNVVATNSVWSSSKVNANLGEKADAFVFTDDRPYIKLYKNDDKGVKRLQFSTDGEKMYFVGTQNDKSVSGELATMDKTISQKFIFSEKDKTTTLENDHIYMLIGDVHPLTDPSKLNGICMITVYQGVVAKKMNLVGSLASYITSNGLSMTVNLDGNFWSYRLIDIGSRI